MMKKYLLVLLAISYGSVISLLPLAKTSAITSAELRKCMATFSGSLSGSTFYFNSTECQFDMETAKKLAVQAPAQYLSQGLQNTQSARAASDLYVGLGDSVAAGIGLSGGNTGDVCKKTAKSYVTKIAAYSQHSYMNLACSGATAGDLVTKQRQTNQAAQLDNAFAHGTPALMTITAGANDMQWEYFLRKCYVSRCGTTFDRTIIQSFLTAMSVKLNYALVQISLKSGGNEPRVILTGYYQPFSGTCSALTPRITTSELTWMNQQVGLLNKEIQKTAANFDFASYAPVSFSGHELCTNDPWVQSLEDEAPFHPTAEGQQAIAKSVISEIDRN